MTISLAGPVPPPRPLPLWKYTKALNQDILATYHAGQFEELVVQRRLVGRLHTMVSDPGGIKRVLLDNAQNYPKADSEQRLLGPILRQGLITSEGETWRSHRRIMSPSFDHKSISGYAQTMIDVTTTLAEEWSKAKPGSFVEVQEDMMTLTLQIIGRCMFSSDSPGMVETVRDGCIGYQQAMTLSVFDFVPVFENVMGYVKGQQARKALSNFDNSIQKIIAERAATPGKRTDLLESLIQAQDGDTGGKMSATEVRDQVMTIFTAGHETTALGLTWLWYLLALHPDIEKKMHAELKTVLGGRTPRYEDVPQLVYTRMVIQEAMRLYPPVYTMAWRQAVEPDEIAGRKIPKGGIVQIVPWVIHRHKKLWKSPEIFDPERFSKEQSEARDRFSYIPFSYGPRVCIGGAFAMTELILVVALLAQKFRLRLAEGQVVRTRAYITLYPHDSLKMIIEAA